jgi:hypothetical protein
MYLNQNPQPVRGSRRAPIGHCNASSRSWAVRHVLAVFVGVFKALGTLFRIVVQIWETETLTSSAAEQGIAHLKIRETESSSAALHGWPGDTRT